MKHIIFLCLTLSIVVTACGAAPASTPAPTLAQATGLDPVALTVTETPASTEPPPAATLTVPPTQQPSRTPSAPATCPQVDGKIRAQFGPVFKGKKAAYHDARQAVLDFLNSGGDPQTAIAKLAENGVTASQLDVTADGVREFLLPSGYYSIFGCKDGKYQTLLDLAPTADTGYEPVPLVIEDLNQDGVPEILMGQVIGRDKAKYSLLEWNGEKLTSIMQEQYGDKKKFVYIENYDIYTFGKSNAQQGALNGNWEIVDIDKDGLKEIAIKAGTDVVFYYGFNDIISSVTTDLEEQIILKSDGAGYKVASHAIESTPTATPTSTPLPSSKTCDYKAPNIKYAFPTTTSDEAFDQSIENFLNAGGDLNHINDDFDVVINPIIKDLNKDGIPEILFISQYDSLNRGYIRYAPYIFSCINDTYKSSLDLQGYPVEGGVFINDLHESSMQILSTSDLNKNGFPEIVIRGNNCALNACGNLLIAEWNGRKFVSLISTSSGFDKLFYFKDTSIKDTDKDGVPEVVWTGGIPPQSEMSSYSNPLPGRLETHIYKWNGTSYQPQLVEYGEPVYLFQAVQDGDRFAVAGQFDKAIKSYNNAIKNKYLDWWSKDRQDYLLGQFGIGTCQFQGACSPPEPDPAEKPILQAYAVYRIMLTQILVGQPDLAENTYKKLLEDYPLKTDEKIITGNSPQVAAHPITEMATTFWDEYQASKNMSNACTKAIAYADAHQGFLTYIGSDYHGWQMQIYKPADICPFK